MNFREARTGDEAGLALLARLGDDLGQFSSELLRPGVKARVATVDKQVVGAATAWNSAWHPAWDWAHVAVSPGHRRQGVGSALLQELQTVGPVKTKVRSGSPSASFVAAAGWHIVQTSATYRLTESSAVRVDAELTGHPRDCVASAFLTFYARAHLWDPIGSQITVDDMLAATVRGATSTLLVGDPRHPDAVACLWEADEGWEFSGGPCHDGAQDAVGVLLDNAQALSGDKLLVEADSDMTEVLAELDLRGGEPTDVVHIVSSTPRLTAP